MSLAKGTDRPCGNPTCSTSTGIHDGLTYGSGVLDWNGFWSRPCRTCAVHYQKVAQANGTWDGIDYWPFHEMPEKEFVPPFPNPLGNSTSKEKVIELFVSLEVFDDLTFLEDDLEHNGIRVVFSEEDGVHWFYKCQ